MTHRIFMPALAICAAGLLVNVAAAQTPAQSPTQSPAQPPAETTDDRCRLEQPEAQPKPEDPSPEEEDRTLTETLDACDGVLKPPPTGDAGIAEPPPDEGETPIIRPEEIPPQAPE